MRYLIAALCALAVVLTQVLYGGAMRPVFALPGLLIIGVAGALGLVALFWKDPPSPNLACVTVVGAFAAWLLWRSYETTDVWLGQTYFLLILGCLVIYLLFACVVTNPFHRLTFLGILFLTALLQAAAAGWQFARPETESLLPWFSEQLRLWYEPRWTVRGRGTFLNANHLVWFLNVIGLTALAMACWSRWGLILKILAGYVALACFGGALVTLSRGGLLGLGAGLTVFSLLSALVLAVGARNRRLVTLLILSAAIFAVASVGFLLFKNSFAVRNRFEGLVNESYRPLLMEVAARQFQLEPLLGTGAGTFRYYARMYRVMGDFNEDVYAHNDWVQIPADFGFPALGLLILAVILHGRQGVSGLVEVLRKRMDGRSRPQSHAAAIQVAALAGLAVFTVHSFFDFNMQIPANALLASAFLGMLANPGVHDAGTTRRPFSRRLLTASAAGAAIWLISLGTKAAGPEYYWLKAENAFLAGDLPAAQAHALVGLKTGPSSRLEKVLGDIYRAGAERSGSPKLRAAMAGQAVRRYERCIQAAPLDSWTQLALTDAFMIGSRPRQALFAAPGGIRLAPTFGRGYELYGEALEDLGQLSPARQALRVALHNPAGTANPLPRYEAVTKKILLMNP